MMIFRLFAILGLLISSSLVNADPVNTTNNDFTTAQQTQIQKVVHDYLLNNPQLLIEMSQKLQQQKFQQPIADNMQTLFFNPSSPVVGNPKGDITVIEFVDYQCPHCKHADPLLTQLTESDSNLKVIYKEFPIFGEPSDFAARAALAAAKQNRYAAMHAALMKLAAPFTDDTILGAARAVGINVAQLQHDMNDEAIVAEIKTNKKLAEALGIPGTPAFIIAITPAAPISKITHVKMIPGDTDLETLKQNIDDVRKKR